MKHGDKLRFRGPAGAEFVVTVGPAFTERTIKARVESGEWVPGEEKKPRRAQKASASGPDTDER